MSQLSFEFPTPGVSVPAHRPRPIRKRASPTTTAELEEIPLPLYTALPSVNSSNESATESALPDARAEQPDAIREARHWAQDGWSAKVVKNPEDDGWAVEMVQDGESEPALVCPWTMGRDKKNPKPLDHPAFLALVKSASEVLQRQRQQLHARLHKEIDVSCDEGMLTVALDIVPDEYEPHALLRATDPLGEELACVRVQADFKLNSATARAWIEAGFELPPQAFG